MRSTKQPQTTNNSNNRDAAIQINEDVFLLQVRDAWQLICFLASQPVTWLLCGSCAFVWLNITVFQALIATAGFVGV